MVYFLLIDCLLFLGAYCKPKQSQVLYIISMISLWFVIAFRGLDMGGSDGHVYQMWFQSIVTPLSEFQFNILKYQQEIQPISGFAWLFALIASLAKTLTGSFIGFQIIYATVTFGILYYIVDDLKLKDYQKPLFMFAYLSQQMIWYFCGLLRQSLANLLIWFVLEHKFKRNNALKKLVIVLLAVLTHTSAIIAVVFCGILALLRNVSVKRIFYTSVLMGSFVYLGGAFLIPPILNFMAEKIDDRYSLYTNSMEVSNVFNFALRFVILVLFYCEYNKCDGLKKEEMIRINSLCFVIGSVNHSLAVRMLEYLAIGNYYGVTVILDSENNKRKRIYRIVIFGIFFVIFCRFFFVNATYLVNYRFLWG